jgi:deoxycytidylate deaminase
MICNSKQDALERIHYLSNKVTTVPCSDLMKHIIKLEVKEHILTWNITKEDILSLEAA